MTARLRPGVARKLAEVLAVAALTVACDGVEVTPLPRCWTTLCPRASTCEGDGVCVPDRRLPLWPLPPMPPGADNYEIRDDVVLDRTTGLLWERGHSENLPTDGAGCPGGDPCSTYWRFEAYCAALSVDGGGWRRPTTIEMVSIVDYTRYEPAFDPVAFPDTPSRGYFFPFVSIADGRTGAYVDDATVVGSFVRCVKDSRPRNAEERYVIGAETFLDTLTRLRWPRRYHGGELNGGVSGRELTLVQALAHCESLVLEGHDDWRVPTVIEMQTIMMPLEVLRLSWDPEEFLFLASPGQFGRYFYTSTVFAADHSKYWHAEMIGSGSVFPTAANAVRCVRDEPDVTDGGP